MPESGDDEIARAQLTVLAGDLQSVATAIRGAAAGTPLPWPLADVFARLAVAAEMCEQIIRDQACGVARVNDATLTEVAGTLRLVREVTTALVGPAMKAGEDGC